jgi:hypothetical protein
MLSSDVASLLSEELCAMYAEDRNVAYVYLIGFTADKAVYCMYDYGYESTCYQCSYTIDAATKQVDFGNDMQEVVLTTTITPVVDDNEVSANAGNPAVPAATTETTMTDTKAKPGGDSAAPAANASAPANGNAASTTPAAPAPAASAATVAPETPKVQTTADWLANAPPEIRESVERGMKMHAARKAQIIKALQETKRCKFNEEQLNKMDLEQLENLAELANVPQPDDYSGLNTNQQPTVNENRFSGYAPEPPKLIVNNAEQPKSGQAAA